MDAIIIRLVRVVNVYLGETFHVVRLQSSLGQGWQEYYPRHKVAVDNTVLLTATIADICKMPDYTLSPLDQLLWDGDKGQVWRDALHLWSIRWYNNNTVDIVPQKKVTASADPKTGEVWSVGWQDEKKQALTLQGDPTPNQIASAVVEQAHLLLEHLKQEWERFKHATTLLNQHVQNFDNLHHYEHRDGGKLPRSHVWRPYRFCSQDVLLGATVVRHVKGENCLEVDVFLTEVIAGYEPDSGAEGLTLFLLCEAYSCGGTMEIRFTNQVEGGRLPRAIQELANKYRLLLSDTTIATGRLTPKDSRMLFAALSHLSPTIVSAIVQRNLSIEGICYVIDRAIWSRPELELILLSATRPNRILTGGAPATQPVLRFHDLLIGRSALMAGNLERKLARSGLHPGSIDPEDDERVLDIVFHGDIHAKTYSCMPAPHDQGSEFPVPWLIEHMSVTSTVPYSTPFTVLIRARDSVDLARNIEQDFAIAAKWHREHSEYTFLLIPFDFYDSVLTELREQLVAYASRLGIGVLVCPETTATLDAQVTQRLNSSRIIRHE